MTEITCVMYLPQNQKSLTGVSRITVTADTGEMGLYPDHADSFIALSDGDVKILKSDATVETIHVHAGACYFSGNRFVLFAAS